jgi:FlaA1/EpsC-like NDP-sugar epimerase
MLVWIAFIVTPIIFLIVVIIGIKGQGGLATRIIVVAILIACIFGGIDRMTMKPKREAKQEAALLLGKLDAAHRLAQSTSSQMAFYGSLERATEEIDHLIETLPAPRRLPELHGIVLEGMQIVKTGIELAEKIKQAGKSASNRFPQSDGEKSSIKELLNETKEGDKMLTDNVKKLCSYLKRPEKPLEKFEPAEIPKVCDTF